MSVVSNFEQKMTRLFESTPHGNAPISFKKLASRSCKEMRRETLVVDGVDTAPPLYTVLIGPKDNAVMSRHYSELSSELEQFLIEHAERKSLSFDERPLVRFIVDSSLRSGKFDVIAENAPAIVMAHLRREERAFLSGRPLPTPQSSKERCQSPSISNSYPAVYDYRDMGALGYPTYGAAPLEGAPITELSAPLPSLQEQLDALAGQAHPDDSLLDPALSGFDGDVPQDDLGAYAAPQYQGFDDYLDDDKPAAFEGAFAVPADTFSDQGQHQPGGYAGFHQRQSDFYLANKTAGRKHILLEPSCVIGRDSESADVVIPDPNVSRRHALLTFDGNRWIIKDLNSTNGTVVNGQEIVERVLVPGDYITLGKTDLELRGGAL